MTDPKGQVIESEYDRANRVTQARYKNLAISFGILILLGLSMAFILISVQRERRLESFQSAHAGCPRQNAQGYRRKFADIARRAGFASY